MATSITRAAVTGIKNAIARGGALDPCLPIRVRGDAREHGVGLPRRLGGGPGLARFGAFPLGEVVLPSMNVWVDDSVIAPVEGQPLHNRYVRGSLG